VVVLGVHDQCQVALLEGREAVGLTGLLARLGEDREEDRSQNGNDSDHDEKLDEGEAKFSWSSVTHDIPLLSFLGAFLPQVLLRRRRRDWSAPVPIRRKSIAALISSGDSRLPPAPLNRQTPGGASWRRQDQNVAAGIRGLDYP